MCYTIIASRYVQLIYKKETMCEDMILDWLKEIRGKKTMKEVATNADIVESYYSMIENGVRCPPVGTAKAIARALNFDWHRFYDDDTPNSNGNTA